MKIDRSASRKAPTSESDSHVAAHAGDMGGILDLGEMGADLEDHAEKKLNRSKPG